MPLIRYFRKPVKVSSNIRQVVILRPIFYDGAKLSVCMFVHHHEINACVTYVLANMYIERMYALAYYYLCFGLE